MLSGARKEAIKEILGQKKAVSVDELSKKFSVSSSTIRRDLKLLESTHILRRTHGGAVRWTTSFSSDTPSEKESYREISKIVKLALSQIRSKDTIYLDGGMITLMLARQLKKDLLLNVVTNSLKIAVELASLSQVSVTLTGGSLKLPEFTLEGPLSEAVLEKLNVNKSFIDGVSIDLEKGLTTDDVLNAQMKRMMIKKAAQTFVLATGKSFDKVAFTSVCSLAEIDTIITSRRLSNKIMDKFHQYNVKVIWG